MGRPFLPGVLGLLVALRVGPYALPAEELPAIVFVSRELGREPLPDRRMSPVHRAASGKLRVREPGGAVRTLVEPPEPGTGSYFLTDVLDPDVSFDASRIVFAGFSPVEDAWRIYEVGADGAGLRQITWSDRQTSLDGFGETAGGLRSYDDQDPCYLPDGRICFVSTRYPAYAPDARLRATNLYVVNPDGSDLHRITTERFGADTPAVEPSTGKIVYSRWWRTPDIREGTPLPPPPVPYYGPAVPTPPNPDRVLHSLAEGSFLGVNTWFLSSIHPDGTGMVLYSGGGLDRTRTQAYRPSFLPGGEVVALFVPVTPYLGYPRGYGLRRLREGHQGAVALGGPQSAPPGRSPPQPSDFVYASAAALPDGRILATAAKAATPLDYMMYVQENSPGESPGSLVPIHNDPAFAELDAVPLVAREAPRVIDDAAADRLVEEPPSGVLEAFMQAGAFSFDVENIHSNAPVDVQVSNAPPVGKKLFLEFYMSPPGPNPFGADPPILIRSMEVPPDGRIQARLPAGVPLFEVLRNPDQTIAMGRDGQVFHVGGLNFGRAGQTARCVGCHAGHSRMPIPQDPAWTNLAPSAVVNVGSIRSMAPVSTPPAGGFRGAFLPRNLVDRRTGGPASEYAGDVSPAPAKLRLAWTIPLRARALVVHGIRPDPGQTGRGDQVVHAFTVTTYLDGRPHASIPVARDVLPGGLSVALDPRLPFNALEVTISPEDVTGEYEGSRGVGLAELEVIARVAGPAAASFKTGDVNCDHSVNVTDAVVLIAHLYLGGVEEGGGLCCLAAADLAEDGRLNVTDAVSLLGFMFGISQPPPAFGRCQSPEEVGLECERETCQSGL